jgi:hypothetical protein
MLCYVTCGSLAHLHTYITLLVHTSLTYGP